MPKIKSAKKALRVSKKRTKENLLIKKKYKIMLAKLNGAAKEKQKLYISQAFSALDKAAKNHLLHPNKVARMKSQISVKFKMVAPEKIPTKRPNIVKKTKKVIKKKK